MDKAYRNNDMEAAQAEQVCAGSWMAAAAQLALGLDSLADLLCTPQFSIGFVCASWQQHSIKEAPELRL